MKSNFISESLFHFLGWGAVYYAFCGTSISHKRTLIFSSVFALIVFFSLSKAPPYDNAQHTEVVH